MKEVQLVLTDLDSTLLTSDNEVPKQFYELIPQLEDLGVTIAIASGRPLITLKNLFPDPKMVLICDNGGLIYYNGKIRFKSLIPVNEYQSMISLVNRKTKAVPIVCGLDAGYIPVNFPRVAERLTSFFKELRLVDDMSKLNVEADKFTAFSIDQQSRKTYQQVMEPALSTKYSVVVGSDEAVDVMNKGINKGSAVKFLGEQLKIEPQKMMAFGDAENDASMLKRVKYSYLVSNHAIGMEKWAKYRTSSNDDLGVIKVLNQLMTEKN
ncbi:Cof-type HAD-IIB family hydrolase [Xylocopilactobacillus apis]|uniref:Haloacid dehalogenase n=1 Tax=Xylocopilactobacillus apis TaxID=2932183 RepID=A0AAU9D7G6_9LACO|nr:HAD family hydrolase [Xylocopilactobacillus apis]BDR57370.1 haloacid dehalogenase [Xylocopilactobacillus apis]